MTARVLLSLAALLLVSCGEETTVAADHALPTSADRVAITPEAIAAIALDHLPGEPDDVAATYVEDDPERGRVGADLRFNAGEAEDGELVRVSVQPVAERVPCRVVECVELDTTVEGATLLLVWENGVEDQEPGYWAVRMDRPDGESALVLVAARFVDGDPRETDDTLVDVDTVVELVEDPWLRLRTSPEAIEAGAQQQPLD